MEEGTDEQIPLLPTKTDVSTDAKQSGVELTAGSAASTSKNGLTYFKHSPNAKAEVPAPKPINSDAVKKRKKQPPFLEREVLVSNPSEVDQAFLLRKLLDRFGGAYLRWRERSGLFKLANLVVTLILVVVQVAQVLLFQLSDIPISTKTSIATILPAVTGAVLAIQLKLGWGEKAVKCKRSARLYNQLSTHVQYRLDMAEAGGVFDDSVQVMLFQFPSVAFETKNSVATIIPAITGAALALQLKLGWGEKAVKCKKCARLYNKLANHVQYRLEILEAGGTLSDSVKVWNTALTSEIAEIPPFLTVY